MAPRIHRFMADVLGDEAATALRKAAERSDAIDSIVGPRTIVGWLEVMSQWPYDGAIPGFPGTVLKFEQGEGNDFDGHIQFGKDSYTFTNVDLTHVAAAVACALGVDQPVAKGLRDSELLALGQNINLLIKTQVALAAEVSEETSEEPVEKQAAQETPGPQVTQRKPLEPTGFTAPRPTAPSRTKRRGFQTVLTRSQADARCSVCERAQFRGDTFRGCACLQDLAKHATAERVGEKLQVSFDPNYWTESDVKLFLEIVGEADHGE